MKKKWYTIYSECIKYNPSLTVKVGEVTEVGKIQSEGLAYITAKAIQESMGNCFIVYYK